MVDRLKIVLAIIGSRTFTDYEYAKGRIEHIIDVNNVEVIKIVSGGADGADTIAEIFALEHGIPIRIHRPDWSLGRHAGFLRNADIIENCTHVIALWDGSSKGTADSLKKAKNFGKKIVTIIKK